MRQRARLPRCRMGPMCCASQELPRRDLSPGCVPPRQVRPDRDIAPRASDGVGGGKCDGQRGNRTPDTRIFSHVFCRWNSLDHQRFPVPLSRVLSRCYPAGLAPLFPERGEPLVGVLPTPAPPQGGIRGLGARRPVLAALPKRTPRRVRTDGAPLWPVGCARGRRLRLSRLRLIRSAAS